MIIIMNRKIPILLLLANRSSLNIPLMDRKNSTKGIIPERYTTVFLSIIGLIMY